MCVESTFHAIFPPSASKYLSCFIMSQYEGNNQIHPGDCEPNFNAWKTSSQPIIFKTALILWRSVRHVIKNFDYIFHGIGEKART